MVGVFGLSRSEVRLELHSLVALDNLAYTVLIFTTQKNVEENSFWNLFCDRRHGCAYRGKDF